MLHDCSMTTHFSPENEPKTAKLSGTRAENCAGSFFCALLLSKPFGGQAYGYGLTELFR
jgi:hypothetical protein